MNGEYQIKMYLCFISMKIVCVLSVHVCLLKNIIIKNSLLQRIALHSCNMLDLKRTV